MGAGYIYTKGEFMITTEQGDELRRLKELESRGTIPAPDLDRLCFLEAARDVDPESIDEVVMTERERIEAEIKEISDTLKGPNCPKGWRLTLNADRHDLRKRLAEIDKSAAAVSAKGG